LLGLGRQGQPAGASRQRLEPGPAVRIPRQLGRAAHRAQDAGVRAAAADIARQGRLDLRVVRIGVLLQQRDRAHDHAGRAVAALEGSDQSFDGGDGVAGNVGDARLAGPHGLTVEQYGAGAARTLAAARLRPCQPEFLAERVEQTPIRLERQFTRHPIHDDLGGTSHARPFHTDAGNGEA
jgi:hypothetical protein